jgi:hypothetical protein
MASVYAVFSCRNGAVRYVGMTTGAIDRRFRQHLRGPYQGIGVVRSWMHGEWRDGFPVRNALLEWCEDSQVNERETHWINLFDNLLNDRKYYRPHQPLQQRARTPKMPAITSYIRNHIFNCEGRHGVHFRHSVNMYFVLVPDRHEGLRPLIGDELPGVSRAIWFSDLARAINARDRYRSLFPKQQWPRDKLSF